MRRRLRVWERDGGVCGICGTPANPAAWHLDHIVPRSRGGSDHIDNLRVAHPRCNDSRGNRDVDAPPLPLRLGL